jgi:hypothetical protein
MYRGSNRAIYTDLPTAPAVPMYAEPGEAAESVLTSTAAEWAVAINNGTGIAIITDQQAGIGLYTLVPNPNASATTPSSSGSSSSSSSSSGSSGSSGSGKTLLIIGDSMAEYPSGTCVGIPRPGSLYDFKSQCPTLTRLINKGVGGGTAKDWAESTKCPPADPGSGDPGKTGAAALQTSRPARTTPPPTPSQLGSPPRVLTMYHWLSVGGNDFMNALCDKSKIDAISID